VEREVDHDREVKWTKRQKKWRNAHPGDRDFTWKEESGVSYGLYRYVVRCDLVHRQTGEMVGSCLGSCSTLESKYVDRPRDCENTVIKMAEKRAHVGATLLTFGLSEQFTQDVEDTYDAADATKKDAKAGALTLEEARAYPNPWKTPAKYAGKPLEQLSLNMLDTILASTKKLIADKGSSEARQTLARACEMVIEFLKSKSAAAPAAPSAPSTPPATPPSSASTIPDDDDAFEDFDEDDDEDDPFAAPKAKREEPGRVAALALELSRLLDHATLREFAPEIRDEIVKRHGTKDEEQWLTDRIRDAQSVIKETAELEERKATGKSSTRPTRSR
jgi:hypothetical protein